MCSCISVNNNKKIICKMAKALHIEYKSMADILITYVFELRKTWPNH